MQKILPKKWDKHGTGRQRVFWLEWDGHCMCTKTTKSAEVDLPDYPDLLEVTDAIKNQVYGHNTSNEEKV